jgi:signal transduction histidine kinase
MKISNKLVLGFSMVIIFTLLLGYYNITGLIKRGKQNNRYHAVFIPLLSAISEVRVGVGHIIRATEEYAAGWITEAESTTLLRYYKGIVENNMYFLRTTQWVFPTDHMDKLQSLLSEFLRSVDEVKEAYTTNSLRKSMFVEQLDRKTEELDYLLSEVSKETLETVRISALVLKKDILDVTIINIVTLFLIISTSVIVTFRVTRSILGSIRQLKIAAKEIGRGNLDAGIRIESKDETGELASSFKQMAEDLKRSRAEVIAAQTKLIQTGKMASVGQLAGGVAHEINNPLTGVLNNVQLIKMLAEQKNDFNLNDFKELLDIVEESAIRCKKITSSLLEFSRTAAGEHKAVSLNEVTEKVLVLIEHELHLGNILIQTHLYPGLPCVSGDSQLLQQVIFDLISNAKWAIENKSGKDGGIITITTNYTPQDNSVCLVVSDTGVGIPKENLEKIFDPFFATKPPGEGTGLGLSIIFSIIKSHKATIQVESAVGQGAVFKMCFPVIRK